MQTSSATKSRCKGPEVTVCLVGPEAEGRPVGLVEPEGVGEEQVR